MFERILKRLRERIRTRQFVMTVHALEEMEGDELSIYDIENTILTGSIIDRQKDEKSGEWKYLVRGRSASDEDVVVVGKLSQTNKLVIITVYVE
jgi:hypothetical protein